MFDATAIQEEPNMCQACPFCVECDAGSGLVVLKAGYQALDNTIENMTESRHYSALLCPIEEACLSQPLVSAAQLNQLQPQEIIESRNSSCMHGAGGRLCAMCEPGFAHGRRGTCIECVAGDSSWWALGFLSALIFFLLYAAAQRVRKPI